MNTDLIIRSKQRKALADPDDYNAQINCCRSEERIYQDLRDVRIALAFAFSNIRVCQTCEYPVDYAMVCRRVHFAKFCYEFCERCKTVSRFKQGESKRDGAFR